ncbi:hypothetical protein PAXRUDRAFT_18488 [Paxillus rubicundulus Ve08.2h10]|uniref:Uncharacterized protein n=1 Tax=Paxillus rubicundulus Ve08.2h10 TaxID=930991 RepID=A0A0D0CLE0_9AGAM|nr:hypothetical protein PAXRUDRAFT_18488 [Paxillus rubicundulus Ve08.2h10]
MPTSAMYHYPSPSSIPTPTVMIDTANGVVATCPRPIPCKPSDHRTSVAHQKKTIPLTLASSNAIEPGSMRPLADGRTQVDIYPGTIMQVAQ